jgi:hypothetical protein
MENKYKIGLCLVAAIIIILLCLFGNIAEFITIIILFGKSVTALQIMKFFTVILMLLMLILILLIILFTFTGWGRGEI